MKYIIFSFIYFILFLITIKDYKDKILFRNKSNNNTYEST